MRASASGAHVLIGKVKNQSSGKLKLIATQLEVLDSGGRRIRSSVIFSSTYVRSIYPHNGIGPTGPAGYPEAEQRRVGYLTEIEAGKSAPLTVSWQEPRGRSNDAQKGGAAARIDYGKGYLPIAPAGGAGA